LTFQQRRRRFFFFFFGLDFVGAWSAGLELAVFAFEDVPVRTRMAHRADPLNEGRFRLEEVERVVTVSWDSHCEEASFGEFGWLLSKSWSVGVSSDAIARHIQVLECDFW